jgi:hypothetical protein
MLLLNAFCDGAAPGAPPVVAPGQPTPQANALSFASDTRNQDAEHHHQPTAASNRVKLLVMTCGDVGEDGR